MPSKAHLNLIADIFKNNKDLSEEDLLKKIHLETNLFLLNYDEIFNLYLDTFLEKPPEKPVEVDNSFLENIFLDPVPTKSENNEILEKILKRKKGKKYYRELDQKGKDFDNAYDYCIYKSIYEKLLIKNKFNEKRIISILDYFSDEEIEFRKIILKILNFNKQEVKDKTYFNDLVFLEKYFESKLKIERNEEGSKKLSVSIARLLKKIQLKIFESSINEDIEIFYFLKNRLYIFYNHYRK